MPAKRVESFRQKEGNKFVTRLFRTQPLIDNKWVEGLKQPLPLFLINQYSKEEDKWLADWKWNYKGEKGKVVWWDDATHEELKSKVPGYKHELHRKDKDELKLNKSRELVKQFKKQTFVSDNWIEAQEKYIEWCKQDGCEVKPLEIGKNCGDD